MTIPALLPAPPTRPPLLRLVPPLEPRAAAQAPLPLLEPDAPLAHAPEVPLEVQHAVRGIARALCEALAGRRPIAQVRPVLTPRVSLLADHLLQARVAVGQRLAGVRVQVLSDGVAEASLRLSGAERSAAMAVRIERRGSRWIVSALEAALGPDVRRPARA